MAIINVEQPNLIQVADNIRLRKYDGKYDFAYKWYQDEDIVYLVSNTKEVYTKDTVKNMYEYLNRNGELYFIEILENSEYIPIGDVTFWREDMPIVIGDKNYRGIGIGGKVVQALICRAKKLGYKEIYIDEIYSYNIGSRKCFEKNGFKEYKKTERGSSFRLVIK